MIEATTTTMLYADARPNTQPPPIERWYTKYGRFVESGPPPVITATWSNTWIRYTVPSSAPSSRYERRCGSVSWRNVPNAVAPSTFDASSTSDDWLCSPASTISIMNGVHCQTSTAMIEARG